MGRLFGYYLSVRYKDKDFGTVEDMLWFSDARQAHLAAQRLREKHGKLQKADILNIEESALTEEEEKEL